MKCPKCGAETRIQVQATLSAPSNMYCKFSKSNLRKKEVYLLGVNWETADFICGTCRHTDLAYGNYVSRLARRVEYLEEVLKDLHDTSSVQLGAGTFVVRNKCKEALQGE